MFAFALLALFLAMFCTPAQVPADLDPCSHLVRAWVDPVTGADKAGIPIGGSLLHFVQVDNAICHAVVDWSVSFSGGELFNSLEYTGPAAVFQHARS